MILQTLLAILIIAITIYIDVKTDLKLGAKVNHERGALLRLIGIVPACVLLGWPYWGIMICSFPMVGFIYWTLFDGIYGVSIHLGFFSTGNVNPNKAITDRFLGSIPIWARITIKFVGIALSTWFYIHLRY